MRKARIRVDPWPSGPLPVSGGLIIGGVPVTVAVGSDSTVGVTVPVGSGGTTVGVTVGCSGGVPVVVGTGVDVSVGSGVSVAVGGAVGVNVGTGGVSVGGTVGVGVPSVTQWDKVRIACPWPNTPTYST